MKRILHKSIGALLLLLSAVSCDDFFDEPADLQDINNTFSSAKAINWLAHGYALMPTPVLLILTAPVDYAPDWWEFTHPYVMMADEGDINDTRYCYASWRINKGDWNPSESDFGAKWVPLYNVIRHLYIFLDNVKVVPGQLFLNSQEEVDELKLQARFLIAYYHVLLFEQFGPIPLVLEAMPTDATVDELKLARNSVDEVVDWLDNELLTVANLLPENPLNANQNISAAPTPAAALALRARLLLYAASPLFNSPDNYASMREFATLANRDGKKLFPQSYDREKWKRAADAAKLIITTMPKYRLHGETAVGVPNSFEDAYRYYREVFTVQLNSEVLFARTLREIDFGEYLEVTQPAQYKGAAVLGVTQKLVDAFYMDDGSEPVESNPYYSESGFTTDRDDITINKLVANDDYKIDEVFNMYQNREARFYASVFFNGRKWEAQKAKEEGVIAPVDYFLNGASGSPKRHPATGMTPYKYIDEDDLKGESRVKRPPLFRLAEVYLNYAEALNHYSPGDPDILRYLNKVRNRAGLPNYEVSFPGRTSQEEIWAAIIRERAIELNWEGNRYFDTRRNLLAEVEDNGPFYGMNTQGDTKTSFYKRTVFETRVFKTAFYLYPIPQWEIDKNEKLVQNPYWR